MGKQQLVESPEELERRVDGYFEQCKKDETPPTFTGLLLHTGLKTKQRLSDYGQREEFAEVVEYARARMQEVYEQNLHGPNPTGSIFALKNMGWSDRQELEHSGPDGGPIRTACVTRPKLTKEEWLAAHGVGSSASTT